MIAKHEDGKDSTLTSVRQLAALYHDIGVEKQMLRGEAVQ